MLSRLLTVAHFAPSAGFMQPWSFLLVRDAAVKRRVYDAFLRANADDLADAGRLPGLSIKTRLAITCLDQIGDDKVTYYGGGLRRRASVESFVSAVSRAVGARRCAARFRRGSGFGRIVGKGNSRGFQFVSCHRLTLQSSSPLGRG